MRSPSPRVPFRALVRVLNARLGPMHEGAAADAGFDAGEWSGPIWDRQIQEEFERVLARYGWTADAFDSETMAAFEKEYRARTTHPLPQSLAR